jgi:hypothetical protein
MTITDALQIALSYDGLFGALICTALCYLIYWALKLLGITIQFLEVSVKFLFGKDRKMFLRIFAHMLFWGGCVMYYCRAEISDFVQRFETPVYDGQYDGLSSDNISEAFERKIMDLNPAYISNEVIKRTRLLAAELQIPPHYIYQTALSECSLKPLTIRRDGIAAGWIQFTAIGLSGITSESFADVKEYCKNGQISQIMDLTDKYVRYHTKGKKIERAVDFYLVVFSPANLGRGNDAVLYEGANNPAYYLNDVFDGYTQKADGRIVRSRKNIDYRITVGELALCIEAKKNKLIQNINK